MNSRCNRIQELLAAECAAERPWVLTVEEHLRGCEPCAQKAQAMVRNLHALGELPMVSAPAELDGRIVAASQAGFRQERAVNGLAGVDSVAAPAALDLRIDGLLESMRDSGELPEREAPFELEERVDQSLKDLPGAISQAFLSKLEREPVPAELAARVHADLTTSRQTRSPWRVLRSRQALVGLSAAAALVLMVGFGTDLLTPTGEPSVELAFRVDRAGRLDALSAPAAELMSRLDPGLSSAIRSAQDRERIEIDLDQPTSAALPGAQTGSGSRASGGTQSGTHGRRVGVPGGQAASGQQQPGSGSSAVGAGAPGAASFAPRFGPEYLVQTGQAMSTVSFRGDRRVLTRTMVEDLVAEVDYREEIISDGAGQFRITPLELLTPFLDFDEEAAFIYKQETREGFLFRHRGFVVRNVPQFFRNYEVANFGQLQLVAGRSCERLTIERQDGTGDRFVIAIDPLTSLVMSEERLNQNNELVSKIWYETFELNPDLSGVPLTGGPSEWIGYDPQQPPAVFTETILQPTSSPVGFELNSSSYQASAGLHDLPWSQFIYSDGADEIFFLCEDARPAIGNGASSGQVLPGQEQDTVRLHTFGQWTMIEGLVRDRFVLAVGRADEQELLLMLQSAVE
jgi:hypothetical protein